MRNFIFPAALIAPLLLSLAGCTVGPNYQRPVVSTPSQYKERSQSADASTSPIAYTDWWSVFHDPILDGLESQAVAANLDVRMALARVEQAEAGTKFARSFKFPTISVGAGASRNREAQNRPNNGNTNGLAATYNDFQLPLILNYEVDAWGRVRRSIEAAQAAQQASAADLRFVKLSIEANLAIDYYSLRENDAEQQVLQFTLQQLRKAVGLTANRFHGGLNSQLEVEQAQTLVDQTVAQAQALNVQRAQFEHAIALLIGRPASEFSLPQASFEGVPPEIPAGIPADLLARRPDIAEADRNVASASANIGVAKTAGLPHISLTGLAGFESAGVASLFSWENSIASLGASAVTPLFNGGSVRAGVDQAAAVWRESLAQYQKTVLAAYQEVEDQLAALRILQGEAESESAAINDARQAEQIALNRYTRGLVGYLDVVFAQETLLENQRVATQIGGQRLLATVMLIKGLGGGWLQVPSESSSPPLPSAGPAVSGRAGESSHKPGAGA